jgi:hypothetical protein
MTSLIQILMAATIIGFILIHRHFEFKRKSRQLIFNLAGAAFCLTSTACIVGYHLGLIFPAVSTKDHIKANQWHHYIQGHKIGTMLNDQKIAEATVLVPKFQGSEHAKILKGLLAATKGKTPVKAMFMAMPSPKQRDDYIDRHPDLAESFYTNTPDAQNTLLENSADTYDRSLKACARSPLVVLLALPDDWKEMHSWSRNGNQPRIWLVNGGNKAMDELLASSAVELTCGEIPTLNYAERIRIPSYDAVLDFKQRFLIKSRAQP